MMNKTNLRFGLVALAGLGLSANVNATDLTCSDIEFTPEAFAAYEFADQACLEMVDRNGATFAKFTATKVVPADISPGVSTFLRFQHADGSEGPRHKSALPRGYQIMLDDKPVRLADINEGQRVNIYVGSEFWVAPEAEVAVAMAEVAEEVAEVVEEVEEVVEEEMPPVLPKTAGPLPWLALFGSLFLILGGALRLARKQ
jgi:hypothetical protein